MKAALLTDANAVDGHDQRLLAWALASGRVKVGKSSSSVTVANIAHDDECPRPSNRGACICKPHLRIGMDLIRYEDFLFSTCGGRS